MKHAYRFGVKSSNGNHSSVWRVWTSGNDIYVSQRGMVNLYKASFHESGDCQVGLTSALRGQLESPEWQGQSRLYDKWEVKAEVSPNSSQELVQIVFPYSQLENFELEDKNNSKINWLMCNPEESVCIAVFKANIPTDRNISSSERDFRQLCRLPLTNGYSCIVLHRTIEEERRYTDLLSTHFNCAKMKPGEKTYTNGAINENSPSERVLLWRKQDDGRRTWFEGSVQKLSQGEKSKD